MTLDELFWLPWILVVVLSLLVSALYYHNHRLRHLYLKLSSRDDVTELKNQVAILARLEFLLKTALRYQHALTIGMLQIPGLKNARKEHGNPSVDKYTVQVANILREELRSTDRIGRYDFDKFLLILTNTNSHDSRAVFSRIIDRLEGLPLHGKTLKQYLGMTNRHSKTQDVKSFVKETEKALGSARRENNKNIQGYQVERLDH